MSTNSEKQQLDREIKRQRAIRDAVAAADKIILEASDGSVEETNYLTATVARFMIEKALSPFWADIMHYDMFGQGLLKHWKDVRQQQQKRSVK